MAATDETHYLLVRSAQRVVALRLADVRETMRPLPTLPIAGAPPYIVGAAIIRGAPTPVIDAAAFLTVNGEARAHPRTTRFVTLRIGDRSAALAVEGVLDVRRLAAAALDDLPSLLHGADSSRITALGVMDDSLLAVLNAARLVPPAVWSTLDAAGAAA